MGCAQRWLTALLRRPQDPLSVLERGAVAKSGASLHWGVLCLVHVAHASSLTAEIRKAVATIDQAHRLAYEGGFCGREACAFYLQASFA